MIRANFISPKGAWHAKAADSILLDYNQRNGNGAEFTTTRGLAFKVDLPRAATLRGGDALVLEDGRLIEIVSAPEELAEIRVGEPRDLARRAWTLGGRHLPVQILANRLRVRRDAAIEDLARGLGGKIAHIEAPFDPEGGAYAGPDVEEIHHVHGPDCGHDHHAHGDHGHDHHGHDGHDHGGHDHHAHGHDDHKHDDHGHDHGHHDHKHG